MSANRKPASVTRAQLYELVWAAPLSKIAEDFETRAYEIGFLCDQFKVPWPGVGYWQSVSHGKAPERPPLPPSTAGCPKSIKIAPYQAPAPSLAALVKLTVGQSPLTVSVAATLQAPHPQIAARLARTDGASPLSKLGLRSHCIADAFLKAMEQRGHRLDLAKGETFSLRFLIDKEPICFSIDERSRISHVPLSRTELTSPYNLARGITTRRELVGTRILRFAIDGPFGKHLKWEDNAKQTLESQVGTFVIAMEVVAREAVKHRRELYARDALQRKETEREEDREYRKQMDEDRWDRLCAVANDRQQAQRVRSFLSALKEAAAGDDELVQKAERWNSWAQNHLRQLDPLSYSAKETFQRLARPKPPRALEYP